MAKLTVNIESLPTGTLVELPPSGLFPNGYVHELVGLETDTLVGAEPGTPLDEMPAATRVELVIARLEADATAYDATEHDDEDAAVRARARVDEIRTDIARYRSMLA